MKIPFSPPYIDETVEQEVLDSLRSGWITTGPKVQALQKEVASLANIENVLCVNSATSGMMLTLHWFGVGPGDEVILPAYTYCATALVVMHLGAKPIIVDVDDDFCISIDEISKAITSKTKAIMGVDFAGFPCDYDQIYSLLESVKQQFVAQGENQERLGRPLLLADAAHSIGANYKGKPSGSLADLSVFSFHAVKNVTTAEGGAICINLPKPFENKKVFETLKLWSLNGQTKDAFAKSKAGGWRYDIVYPGFKINMADINAAIGLAQLRLYVDNLLVRRNNIYDKYSLFFKEKEWAIVPHRKLNYREGCGHLYPLRIEGFSESQRDSVIDGLALLGISVNVHFVPLPMLSVFRERGFKVENTPNAKKLYSNEISLPIYPQLRNEEVEYLLSNITSLIDLEINREQLKCRK